MSQELNELLSSFEKAIEHKEMGKFCKDDVDAIYQSAHKVFDGRYDLSRDEVGKVRDLWVKLAEGKIDKGRATKKLQGTSRAEAIQSVLSSML